MNVDPEFKRALQLMPEEEKDKLVLRLLRRDPALAAKLRFELLATDSVEDKREEMKNRIYGRVQEATIHYNTPGILLWDARAISGEIAAHVKTTSDKLGDISLNSFLVLQLLLNNNKHIAESSDDRIHTLSMFILSKIFKIMVAIQKLPEDYHLAFRDEFIEIGELIGNNDRLFRKAMQNGLDLNWLTLYDIPKDIATIHQQLLDKKLLK